jgi:hypothetical protein
VERKRMDAWRMERDSARDSVTNCRSDNNWPKLLWGSLDAFCQIWLFDGDIFNVLAEKLKYSYFIMHYTYRLLTIFINI